MMSAKMRNALIAALMVLVSVGLTVLFVEGALRLLFIGSLTRPSLTHPMQLHPPHPTRGWALAPNATALLQTWDYRSFVHVNSKGLFDREHEYEPAPGVFRILILGSSFMEGYQVELEQTFARLLERALADQNVEVINMGTIAYGCGQEYLALKEDGLKYKPNLVLSAFGPQGEVHNDSKPLETLLWNTGDPALNRPADYQALDRPYPSWDEKTKQLTFAVPDFNRAKADFEERVADIRRNEEMKPFWQNTMLYDVVSRIQRSRSQRKGAPGFDPNVLFLSFLTEVDPKASPGSTLSAQDYNRLWDEAWTMTTHVIHATRDLAEQNHARFAMFTVPTQVQVDAEHLEVVKRLFPTLQFDLDKTNRLLAAFADEQHIPLFELTRAFREHYEQNGPPLFFQLDPHWNTVGHRVAAAAVAAWLREQGLVPQRAIE